MTIGSSITSQQFGGNGVQTSFPFSIPNYNTTSVFILMYTSASGVTSLVPTNQYTITLNLPAAGQIWGVGGTITYSPAIAAGTSLTIQRLLPILQGSDLSNQGNLWPLVVEIDFDTVCMQIQQVAARTGQWRGTWATGTQYNFGDIIQDGANGANTLNYYMCTAQNLSGTWSTDLSNGDWIIFINVQQIITYMNNAAASAAAALVSQNAAAASQVTATSAASTATTQAGIATTQAGTATTEAGIATTQASNAATSASGASTSASTATTQAGIATTEAGIATTQAGIATTEAGVATTQAGIATTQATNAAASALAAASTITATSTTSNTIGTGSFTFTTQANKNFFPGQFIVIASNANGANYIHGQVTSYSGTTLVMTESDNGGSGAHTDWNISASGPQGASGSGAGTVTSVSVATANGFSGTVSNPTSTPAITIVAGAITPSSVASTGAVSGTTITGTGAVQGTQLISTVATGTAPLSVTSTTAVPNLSIGGNAATATTAAACSGNAATATSATSATTATTTTGNAGTATSLATPRTIAITGDIAYNSGNFDGSANVTAAGTLATVNANVGSYTNASITVNGKGLITAASSGTSTGVMYGSIGGFIISSIAGNSTTASFSISAGGAADSTGAAYISKATTLSWAASNGNAINGTDAASSTLANSTTYHVFVCTGASGTGSFVSASLTPTFPTGYAVSYRRIGSFNTTGAGAPVPYTVIECEGGGTINWLTTQVLDMSAVTVGTSRVAQAMSVPSGIKNQWLGRAMGLYNSGNGLGLIITSGDETDVAPQAYNGTSAPMFDACVSNGVFASEDRDGTLTTNTSAQIGFRASGASMTIYAVTRGWKDFRRS